MTSFFFYSLYIYNIYKENDSFLIMKCLFIFLEGLPQEFCPEQEAVFRKESSAQMGRTPHDRMDQQTFQLLFPSHTSYKSRKLFFFFFFHPWFYCCFVVQMRHLPCTIKVHILRLVVAPPRVDRTAEKTVLGVLKCSETVPEEPLKTRLGGFQDFHVLHPTVNQWKAWMRERETKEKAIRNHKNHDIGQVLLLGFEP